MDVPYRLDGRVALVTGASRGLGEHFGEALASAGAKVAVTGRAMDRLTKLAERLGRVGATAAAFAMDVTKAEEVERTVSEIEAALGPIDILVNNSGVAVTKPALEMDEADWDLVVDTNLKGAWLVAKTVARQMAQRGEGGKIINIASVAATRVLGQVGPYCASKAGLAHLTRSLAVELARYDIQVNAIAPGYVETEMNKAHFQTEGGQRLIRQIPQRRLGKPADLDGALYLLASDASRFMTGSLIAVDGGHNCAY